MGLDVGVYSHLILAHGLDEDEGQHDDNLIVVEPGPINRLGEMVPGYYRETATGHWSFRAGGYGSYNDWRKILCDLVHKIDIEDLWKLWYEDPEFMERHPFIELICFSDCEGAIGTDICRKLYQDFAEYQEILREYSPDGRWLYIYEEFMGAFEHGQNSGFVKFC